MRISSILISKVTMNKPGPELPPGGQQKAKLGENQ